MHTTACIQDVQCTIFEKGCTSACQFKVCAETLFYLCSHEAPYLYLNTCLHGCELGKVIAFATKCLHTSSSSNDNSTFLFAEKKPLVSIVGEVLELSP